MEINRTEGKQTKLGALPSVARLECFICLKDLLKAFASRRGV